MYFITTTYRTGLGVAMLGFLQRRAHLSISLPEHQNQNETDTADKKGTAVDKRRNPVREIQLIRAWASQ